MNRIIYFVTVLFSVMTVLLSCDKEPQEKQDNVDISGEWQLKTVSDIEALQGVSVYVSFSADGVFTVYQKIGEGRYRYYKGTYTVENDILSGTYDDGNPMASQYKISLEKSGKRLVLKPLSESVSEERVYDAVTIPEDVKRNAISTKRIQIKNSL